MQPVPCAAAGTEVDLTVQLVVPQKTGRHMAYFRLRGPDGHGFGHRFWVDLLVVDAEASGKATDVHPRGADVSPVAVTAAPVVPANATSSIAVTAALNTAATIEPAPTAPTEAVADTDDDDDGVEPPVVKSTIVPCTESLEDPAIAVDGLAALNNTADLGDVWAKELQVFAAMGFTDEPKLLALLREHAQVPVAMRPEMGGIPAAEGMQRVIAVLLNEAGLMA